jgi:hypothetical protein
VEIRNVPSLGTSRKGKLALSKLLKAPKNWTF